MISKVDTQKLRGLLSGKGDLLAVFTCDWCGYCRSIMRDIERSPPGYDVVFVDISDESDSAWDDYKVEVVPTAVLFRDGREVARKRAGLSGLRPSDLDALVKGRAS